MAVMSILLIASGLYVVWESDKLDKKDKQK
jgi:uncharacterized iron-regulated membrane protein